MIQQDNSQINQTISSLDIAKESLDKIETVLKTNGYNLNDSSLNIEFPTLKEIRKWVNQDDKILKIDWDKVENCFAIMLNEYLEKTNELKRKIEDCAERRRALIDESLNLEVEAVKPILGEISELIVVKEKENNSLNGTINETIKYVRKGFEKIDNPTNSINNNTITNKNHNNNNEQNNTTE